MKVSRTTGRTASNFYKLDLRRLELLASVSPQDLDLSQNHSCMKARK